MGEEETKEGMREDAGDKKEMHNKRAGGIHEIMVCFQKCSDKDIRHSLVMVRLFLMSWNSVAYVFADLSPGTAYWRLCATTRIL